MWENYIIKLQLLYAAVFSFYDKNCSFFVISPLFTVFDRIQQHWRTRKGEEKPERGSRGDAGIAEGVGDFHVGGSEGSVDGGCMSQMLSCGITLTHGDKIGMARMVFFM